ncbi:hypothetical protein HMPREF0620_0034 [Parascardovia denticolens DSM 10105 = JCM 12538]|uniref:Uncharacterized protein n=1 Tax=Parascardovia denticolens DSM 10105 = JCM 12538 TaxID=864564 RepID=E6JYH0_PARDN|nr:hypothetical protein HMPREF0620_0034 [Parascardovia denticolens DSM 10105 = JCM 12538]
MRKKDEAGRSPFPAGRDRLTGSPMFAKRHFFRKFTTYYPFPTNST